MVLYDRGDNKVHHSRKKTRKQRAKLTISSEPRSEPALRFTPRKESSRDCRIALMKKENSSRKKSRLKSNCGRWFSAGRKIYRAESRLLEPHDSGQLLPFIPFHCLFVLPALYLPQRCRTASLVVS